MNDLDIIKVEISKEENPSDRWHLYIVRVSKQDTDKLSKNIKPKWYMHFWKGRKESIEKLKTIVDATKKDTEFEIQLSSLEIFFPSTPEKIFEVKNGRYK